MINKGDLSTAPMWAIRGRKPHEQVIMLYIFEAKLNGSKVKMKELAEDAGTTGASARKVVEQLKEDGVLVESAPRVFDINCHFVPEGRVDAPALPPLPKSPPSWHPATWEIIRVWEEARGIKVGPKFVATALGETIKIVGWSDEMAEAFAEYAERHADKPSYYPMHKFAQLYAEYMPDAPRETGTTAF